MTVYAKPIDSKTVLIFDKFFLDVEDVNTDEEFILIDIDLYISVTLNGENVCNYFDMDKWDKEKVMANFISNTLPKYIPNKTEVNINIKVEEEIMVTYEYIKTYKEGTPQFKYLSQILKFISKL